MGSQPCGRPVTPPASDAGRGGVTAGAGPWGQSPPPPRAAAQLPVLQHVLNLMNTRSFSEYTGDNHFPSHHRHGQFDELIPRGSASVQLRVCRR